MCKIRSAVPKSIYNNSFTLEFLSTSQKLWEARIVDEDACSINDTCKHRDITFLPSMHIKDANQFSLFINDDEQTVIEGIMRAPDANFETVTVTAQFRSASIGSMIAELRDHILIVGSDVSQVYHHYSVNAYMKCKLLITQQEEDDCCTLF